MPVVTVPKSTSVFTEVPPLPPSVLDNVKGKFRCIRCSHLWSSPKDDCDCCEDSHCNVCGQPDCMCCDSCSSFPCECENAEGEAAGFRAASPWEMRGMNITLQDTDKYESWEQAWPALSDRTKIDVCQRAANFYLLDAIRCRVLNREHDCDGTFGCPHAEVMNLDEKTLGISKMAQLLYDEQVAYLDEIFCQYVDMACGGELRHHPCVGGRAVSGTRRVAWAGWKGVREIVGAQALLDMADLFLDWGKKGNTGYGGPLWSSAASLLYDRLTDRITPAQWVDRVFTLVHNGGVFLNKLDWGMENRRGFGLEHLQQKVLPAHATDGFSLLISIASTDVGKLWDQYWIASNKARVRAGLSPNPNLRGQRPRSRRMCRYCNSNPLIGHARMCSLFTNGKLPTQSANWINTIDEEEWGSYDWSEWKEEEYAYPVSPTGEYILALDDTVKVRCFFSRGLNVVESWQTMYASDLLKYQVAIGQVFKSKFQQWPSEDYMKSLEKETKFGLGFTWRIDLFLCGGSASGYSSLPDVNLGQMHSTIPIPTFTKFSKIILDCGLLLPGGGNFKVNWDILLKDWETNTMKVAA